MARRGVALFIVMVVMTVLTMLVVAFLQVNRSHFALVRSSTDRENAYAACQAAYEYCLYELEHDKFWGSAPFNDTNDPKAGDDSDMPSNMTVERIKDSTMIEGTIPSLNATFSVDVANNLNNAAENMGIPGETARLLIRANANTSQRSVDCLVRVAPLFDSSVLSRGTVTIGASQLSIRSRDPWRNMLRAEGEIHIPDVIASKNTRFLQPDSSNTDPKGLMWSKSEIKVGDASGREISGDLARANQNSGGRFVPNSKQHFEIHNLKSEDLITPSTAVRVKAGEYRFTQARARITVDTEASRGTWGGTETKSRTSVVTQMIDVLEYYDPPESPVPKAVYRSETRTDDLNVPVPPKWLDGGFWGNDFEVSGQDVNDVQILYETEGVSETMVAQTGDNVDLTLDGSGAVMANLRDQIVSIQPGTTMKTTPEGVAGKGDFWLTSKRGKLPHLLLTGGGDDYDYDRDDLAVDERGTAIVADGEIRLENAITSGFGTLVAKDGDGRLQPRGSSVKVEAAEEGLGGLVIFASDNVQLSNPDSADWQFYGLVYARKDFFFDANMANATVEGSLVARDGNIHFQNANSVDFIYNPKYLDTMVRDLPLSRIQVERLTWKE